MSFKKILYVCIFNCLFITSAFAENMARVIYEGPVNEYEIKIEKEIKDSGVVEDVVKFINNKILLSKPLYFKFGGKDGPLYDSALNEIFVPYSFVQDVKNRFISAKYSETGVKVNEATMDAVMHTLFHELGHALIFTYDLPVLGKEEDAVDSLATVLLIEYFDNGAEIAISAADLFDLESKDRDVFDEEDFWDEHSLDAQRFYSTLCYVYGSDPEVYSSLKSEIGFSEERAEICIDEYESILRSWFRLIQPYFNLKK